MAGKKSVEKVEEPVVVEPKAEPIVEEPKAEKPKAEPTGFNKLVKVKCVNFNYSNGMIAGAMNWKKDEIREVTIGAFNQLTQDQPTNFVQVK